MLKMGKQKEVDFFQGLFNTRPWATMVGNVDQSTLINELAQAKVWLYPTNFLETFAISALEAVFSKVFPVVRSYGALPYTLAPFSGVDLIERDCASFDDKQFYAERTIAALRENKWQNLQGDLQKFSWESVAADWVREMGL